jgi:hypothetical protein
MSTVRSAPRVRKGLDVEGTGQPSAAPPSDRQIAEWLRLFVEDGQLVEIRAPKFLGPGKQRPENRVKRFSSDDLDEAAREALRLSGRSPGVYFTLNPVRPGLPAGKGATAADIIRRRWLLIDCDPGKHDSSATDAEKVAAVALAETVRRFLAGRSWPAPIVADSGNGAHLLYRIDLAADDGGIVQAVLNALADRFDTAEVKIDRKVFDPPRLCRLYGTMNRKGEPTAERPHRFSRVVEVPADVATVPTELLKALGGDKRRPVEKPPPAQASPATRRTARKPLDVQARASKYLATCEPAVSGQGGHDKTIKVAVEVGPGFDLSPDDAFRLLSAEYNPRCEPPWSERELRHKVEDAYRIESRRGWHLTNGRNGNGRAAASPPAPPPPAELRTAAGDRPEIVISTEEHAVIDAAVAALSVEPEVFQRGNALVTILRDASRIKREKIHRSKGSPRIAPLPNARLRELMTKTAAWKRNRRDRNGDVEAEPAHPPDWAINEVAARGHWPEIRPIEAIIEAPTIRLDGSILDTPGWDEQTELLYEPDGDFPPISASPDREDARYAAEFLLELVTDFPFANEHHRAAWLAALLTPLARFAIDGRCPLFLFDANTPGTGKSKLTDIIATIATGREMSRTAYPDSDEEMRKRITAVALGGDRLMLIDNIATTFGGSALDSAITAPMWKDRKLGASEMTAPLPLFTIWFGTGNNVELKGDVIRRVIPCRLESHEERPEERTDFRIKDLLRHVRANRARLVTAALTLLRAHALAGRPSQDLPALGSFEAWSEVVRAAVHWAIGVDPAKTREELRANDPETIARAALIEGWSELPGATTVGVTVAEAIRFLKADPDRHTKLRDCLMEWSRTGDLPSAKAIGHRLQAIRARVCNGRYVQSRKYEGTHVWRVVNCSK